MYLNSENANPEYFNVSDINYHEGNTVGEVRAMYITPDDIYKWSDETEKTPGTAAPSVSDIINIPVDEESFDASEVNIPESEDIGTSLGDLLDGLKFD